MRDDQVAQVRGFADQSLRNPANPNDASNRRITLIIQYQKATAADMKPPEAVKPGEAGKPGDAKAATDGKAPPGGAKPEAAAKPSPAPKPAGKS